MVRLRQSVAVAIVAALCALALPEAVSAHSGPQRSAAELTDLADVVVTGRVETITSGWDPAVATIYTYVTVAVDEVFKGGHYSRITIKQLGGIAGSLGLAVADQPSFEIGEDVLLFLEARPRDGTLYTSGLSQGKWTMDQRPGGGRIALRGGEAVSLDALRATPQMQVQADRPARVTAEPVEASQSAPFTYMSTPYIYSFSPPVDVQSGGQAGLPGGGFSEISAAMSRWNNAGSAFRFQAGSSSAPRCSSQYLGNRRVTISFNDPCGEISDSGGVLAIGGSYYWTGTGRTVNGQFFREALEGFIINNDSSVALQMLRQSGCFHDVQLHELGHVLGLGHSSDLNAIMYPSINSSCSSGPRGLGADDVQGLQSIYGGSGSGTTPPSSAPTGVSVAVNGTTSITVSWAPVANLVASAPSAATSYRLDFRQSPTGTVLASVTATGSSITIPLPSGTTGTFYVSVTGVNSAGAGPSSAPVAFTIGSAGTGPCSTAPPPVTGVTGSVNAGTARVQWSASAGASSYLVQAGSTQGAADLFPLTDIGHNLGAQASVPGGFTAWVRIFARNACGTSTGVDFFLQ